MSPSKPRHMPATMLSPSTVSRPNSLFGSRSPSPPFDPALTNSPSVASSTQPGTPTMFPPQQIGRSQSPLRTVEDLPLIRCCCGQTDCEILKNNCAILNHVEDDMRAAAQLGQALLHRHETCMAEAEEERLRLVARIEQLQNDKIQLEANNERTTKENRGLMNQIESLNRSVSDADSRIEELESRLLEAQKSVRILERRSERAADMERQIDVYELEREKMNATITKKTDESRDAMQRWRRAEHNIAQLQQQIVQMEQESKEERERHVEILGRMERQREVERELNTAAGRLKGAAAAKTLSSSEGLEADKQGSNVVSHFVRDLLADNANLQLGMTELRELLMNSHDEIQALRDQLMKHQPLPAGKSGFSTADEGMDSVPSSPSLHNFPQGGGLPTKEVHVHHHYHVAHSRKAALKGKKKRNSLVPGMFNPPSPITTSTAVTRSTMSSPAHSPRPSFSIGEALNSDTSLISPTGDAAGARCHKPRDSVASSIWTSSKRDSINTAISSTRRDSIFSERPSEYTASSVASSPVSTRRMFLFKDDAEAPCASRKHKKRISEMSAHFTNQNQQAGIHAIAEEDDGRWPVSVADELAGVDNGDFSFDETEESLAADRTMDSDNDDNEDHDEVTPPPLRRHVSHESIMSLSGGLDIHTLKSRPSQLTLRPLGTASAVVTDVVAQITMSYKPASDIRSSLAGLAARANVSDAASIYSSSPSTNGDAPVKKAPGRWSKWVPWAGYGYGSSSVTSATTSTVATLVSSVGSDAESGSDNGATPTQSPVKSKGNKAAATGLTTTMTTATVTPSVPVSFRSPGVNQMGAVPGFMASVKTRGLAARALADNLTTTGMQ